MQDAQLSKMETLGQQLAAHLVGRRTMAEISTDLSNFRKQLENHRADVYGMLTNVPDFMVDTERSGWLAAYSKLEDLFAKAEKDVRDQDALKALGDDYDELSEQLAFHSLAVREAAWAARGPTSHPGVNELLFLMESFLDDPTEEGLEMLAAKVEVEYHRLEHQGKSYQSLPEFAAHAMEELLPEYQGLLDRISQIQELSEEEQDALAQAFEEWAATYLQFDVDFLQRRYSKVPTIIPAVNFALNCQMLYLDGLLGEDMVDYAAQSAMDTIERGSELFLKEKSLSALDQHSYDDVIGKLIEEIQSLPELAEKDELKEVGGELVRLCQSLSELQSKSEDHGGSRLDYKSEVE